MFFLNQFAFGFLTVFYSEKNNGELFETKNPNKANMPSLKNVGENLFESFILLENVKMMTSKFLMLVFIINIMLLGLLEKN